MGVENYLKSRSKLNKQLQLVAELPHAFKFNAYDKIQGYYKREAEINKFLNKFHQDVIEFEELLSNYLYPPIPNMTNGQVNVLKRYLTNATTDEEAIDILDHFISIRFNDEKMDQLVTKWSTYKWLDKNRKDILAEVIDGHKKELFYLSTLSVFPQIEGILAEFFPEERNTNGKFTGKNQTNSLQRILNPDLNYDSQWDKFYRQQLTQDFKHMEPIEVLSRHAMAHGADKRYGSRANSTKSIIILDYLLTRMNWYVNVNS
ncbi:hypothetical protein [Salsuginibacillus kocurii]|uniref:hypothetical protein n=1 Tax=Salsuginibacillus kocurii TaxID=427078 RepID=UPI000374E089|nr:hypothetical protein [Salsuginibacillus kocurii]